MVPPQVEEAVMTALQPLPADRFASAAEMARVLRAALDDSSARKGANLPTHPWRHVLVTAVLAVSVTAIASRAWPRSREDDTPRVTARLTLPLPPEQVLQTSVTPFAISPDGARIVYAATVGGTARLYLRPMASDVRAIPSTEGAQGPFFSPDGQWIGYQAASKLWKVAVEGGAPIALADARAFCGASWGAAETILFSECDGALHRVSSRGTDEVEIEVRIDSRGTDSATSTTPSSALDVRWPATLPGGRHALVTERQRIGVVDLATGILKPLFDGNQAVYLPTGHILFDAGEGRVRVAQFSLSRLEVLGEPVPAFETFRAPAGGSSFFSVSESGTLVHVTGGFDRWLVLTDRLGRPEGTVPEARGYRFPRFSPDGRRLAVTVDPRPSDIWVVDLADWRATRVTTEGASIVPIWSADGKRIGFSGRGGPLAVTGPGDEGHPLSRVPAGGGVYLSSWAPDGSIFAYRVDRSQYDLVVLAPNDSAWRPYLATPAMERDPALSPDGQWIAYISDRSGIAELYVRPREGNNVGVIASAGGGREPRWADDGREIIFRRGSSLMTVAVQTGTTFRVRGTPRELFAVPYDFSQDNNWDVTADGQHFVFVRSESATQAGLIVVLNWFDTLRGTRGGDARRP